MGMHNTNAPRNWSDQQQAIFDWFEFPNPDLPNIVARARAGCGKTSTIMEAIRRAPEASKLVAAFSKTIELELKARVGNNPTVTVKTLHALGLSCITKFRERINIDFSSTRADKLALDACGTKAPDAIVRLVSKLHTKGRLMAPHATQVGQLTAIAITFECDPDEQWAAMGYDLAYVEQKALDAMEAASNVQSGDSIDGSDMIFLPVRNGWLTKMFDLVVIDEAQDMTAAQLEIAQGVLKPGGRIAIVGDDRQAIFGFIGADCESLDRLKEELNATEFGLTTTYRCGRAIVDLARKLVPDFEAGPLNPEGELRSIPQEKLTAEAGPGDFILSRINAPLVSIAMQLLRAGKRTRVAGRDIGKGLITLIRKMKGRSVPELLAKIESWRNREVSRYEKQLLKATNGRRAAIQSKIEGIIDQAEMLTSITDGARNVREVEERIEALFTDDGLGAAGMITCSSVHRSKGLEADRVFILRETLRYNSIEEQNISYVAITRAKKTLIWVDGKSTIN